MCWVGRSSPSCSVSGWQVLVPCWHSARSRPNKSDTGYFFSSPQSRIIRVCCCCCCCCPCCKCCENGHHEKPRVGTFCHSARFSGGNDLKWDCSGPCVFQLIVYLYLLIYHPYWQITTTVHTDWRREECWSTDFGSKSYGGRRWQVGGAGDGVRPRRGIRRQGQVQWQQTE